MKSERDRSDLLRVPTLTEVVSHVPQVDIELDDLGGLLEPSSLEASRSAVSFDEATIPSVSALLAPIDAQVSVAAPADPGNASRVGGVGGHDTTHEASADAIARALLEVVQRRIDLVFEARVREALGPILARAVDGVIQESRASLASILQEMVNEAVAQELQRHRER